MWQAQLVRRVGHAHDDLPRRDVEMIDRLIQPMSIPAAALPNFDAARIHDLRRIAFRGSKDHSRCHLQAQLVGKTLRRFWQKREQ